MKILKTKLLTLTALFLWAGIAHGVCNLSGYTVRVSSHNGISFLLFRVTHTADYYYVGETTDPFVAATINTSYLGKTKVFVESSLAACPSPKAGGNWIGTIEKIALGA